AGQAGVLAMAVMGGALRVTVSFALACGKCEGDLDLRARCRSRSTVFRYPAISLVTAGQQRFPRRIADRTARSARAKDRSRGRTVSAARRPFRAGTAARAAPAAPRVIPVPAAQAAVPCRTRSGEQERSIGPVP